MAPKRPALAPGAPSSTAKKSRAGDTDAAVPDTYSVKVHDALSLIMRTFHTIVDATPLSIKPDAKKKGGGGFKVRSPRRVHHPCLA